MWSNQQINVDAIINGGVFLCLRPGYYYFTAAMSTREDQTVEIFLNLNSREIVKDTWVKRFNLNHFWYKLQGVSIQCGSYWDYCEARTQWHGVCSKTIRRSNFSYVQKLLCWMVDALTQQLMILWSGCKMDCENCDNCELRLRKNAISQTTQFDFEPILQPCFRSIFGSLPVRIGIYQIF